MQSCNHVDPTRPSRQLFRHGSRKFARIPSSVSIRLETPTRSIALNRRSLPRAPLPSLFTYPRAINRPFSSTLTKEKGERRMEKAWGIAARFAEVKPERSILGNLAISGQRTRRVSAIRVSRAEILRLPNDGERYARARCCIRGEKNSRISHGTLESEEGWKRWRE